MDNIIKASLTVENGVVVRAESELASAVLLGGTASLVLRTLEKHGWELDGEPPLYHILGSYTIRLKKAAAPEELAIRRFQ